MGENQLTDPGGLLYDRALMDFGVLLHEVDYPLVGVMKEYLTNISLRERFGIEDKSNATVSRYIK